MAFGKQGDATPSTVIRTPSLNITPFVTALVAEGASEETAEGVARLIVSLAVAGGRPSWPRTTSVGINGTPYTVVATVKGGILVLVSITRS